MLGWMPRAERSPGRRLFGLLELLSGDRSSTDQAGAWHCTSGEGLGAHWAAAARGATAPARLSAALGCGLG